MRISKFILALVILGLTAVYGQRIKLQDSISGLPVDGALITDHNRRHTLASDASGAFEFSEFVNTDTITVLHASYYPKSLSLTELKSLKIILLVPRIVKYPGIIITGSKEQQGTSSFTTKVDISPLAKMAANSAAELLDGRTTLTIRDYGGAGGLKSVSSRGMNSENTLVLFNDARVNDLRTGIFDLSSISAEGVGSITYAKGLDFEHPFSSGGGVLSINSVIPDDKQETKAWLKFSSDNLKTAGAACQGGISDFRFRASGEYTHSLNDFPFTFQGKDYRRKNAGFTKRIFSGDLQHTGANSSAGLFLGYSNLENGIPGYVISGNTESSLASTNSNSLLSILNWRYTPGVLFNLNTVVSYNHQTVMIIDPSGALTYRQGKKEAGLNDAAAAVKSTFYLGSLTTLAGYEFMSSDVDNTTTFFAKSGNGNSLKRITNRGYLGSRYTLRPYYSLPVKIDISCQVTAETVNENSSNDNGNVMYMYKAGAVISIMEDASVRIKANYASEYRLPTFNERYFSSLYGPSKLCREKNQWYDAGVHIDYNFLCVQSLDVSVYNIRSDEKIIWTPTFLALMVPQNLAKSMTGGVEVDWKAGMPDSLVSVFANYAYTDARNLTRQSDQDYSYNKYIIYTPLNRLAGGVIISSYGLTLSITGKFVDSRYYSVDNSKNSLLPSYFILDGSLMYEFNLGRVKNRVAVTGYNLNNQEYFVIQSYPMPLKSFLFTYNLEI